MNRVLVFGISGDKLGGINTFLLEMNSYMSGNTVFDYVIEGPNSISRDKIKELGGIEYHTCYYRKNPKKYNDEIKKILLANVEKYACAYFNLYSMVHFEEIANASKAGYKIVLHAHNNNVEKNFAYKIFHYINRFRCKKINALRLTNSKLSASFIYGKKKKEEAIHISCAIDVDKFKYSEQCRNKMRKQLGIENKFVVGFSGRLQPQKNPFFLIKIFEKVLLKNPNAVLVICGDGYLEEQLKQSVVKKGISENVLFLGNRKDMNIMYQCFDCFLLPSKFEGLGIVLIEAQSSGLACIASNQVIPNEVKILDSFQFVDLSEGPDYWSNVIIRSKSINRAHAYALVYNSSYNIEKESIYLEKLLINGSN